MELEIKKKRKDRIQTFTGFFSFLIGLISLAGYNASTLLMSEVFPKPFLVDLPMIGFFLGVIGLFTRNHSRMHAWWGISINLFLLLFTLTMFMMSWTINPKP